MSGLVTVKNKREPIMLRYSFWSMSSPSSSASSIVVVLIGSETLATKQREEPTHLEKSALKI
jgi:hypothetical protein